MRALRGVEGGSPGFRDEFEVAYLAADGVERRVVLASAAEVRFEDARPVRAFPSYKGQRNNPGLYWSATMGRHVAYESWLERDHAMELDFDPAVVAYVPQPFWLFWCQEGRPRSHAPDWFARLDDGGGLVVDCRPDERVKPRDEQAFVATGRACARLGWTFRRLGAVDGVRLANVRWLAGYRHPRHRVGPVAWRLLGAFARPRALLEGAEAVGDPIAVLPVLYHLLWCHELRVDLSVLLGGRSLVWAEVAR
jgi:hypothetical protein